MTHTVPSYAREFRRIVEGFRYNRGIRDIFIDWLDIAACAVHQEPYHLGMAPRDEAFDTVEAQYLASVKKYTRDELDAFAKLLALTKMALRTEKSDFLGQLYMELEISQDRSGEFFTPFSVSLMITHMMLDDVATQIEEKGFITVAEPACGGGGMLIAAAKVIEAAGFAPGEVMFFDATDISKPCCDMAYIQTSILGLSGIVRHGNSLSLEARSHRFTPMCRLFPDRTRRFLDSLMPDATEAETKVADSEHSPPTQEPVKRPAAQAEPQEVATSEPEPLPTSEKKPEADPLGNLFY